MDTPAPAMMIFGVLIVSQNVLMSPQFLLALMTAGLELTFAFATGMALVSQKEFIFNRFNASQLSGYIG